jgi:hypothetical protein
MVGHEDIQQIRPVRVECGDVLGLHKITVEPGRGWASCPELCRAMHSSVQNRRRRGSRLNPGVQPAPSPQPEEPRHGRTCAAAPASDPGQVSSCD